MTDLQVKGETFNVEIAGAEDAPALLLSNSLGTTMRMWDPQMEALTRRFRVIRYDARGHGGSVAEDGPYSIDQLGQDAINILDALGVEKAHFMGLSMGGMVGMWIMTHAPERIGRAVLCNTGAHLGHEDLWNTRIRTSRAEGMAPLVATTVDRWFTREFQEKEPDTVKRIAAMVRATPPKGYASCCAALRDMDQREAIRAIANPVLVVVGKQDPATPPAMGGLIAGSIKGAKLIALDAAHLSNIEAAAAFTRAVVAFLSGPATTTAARSETADATTEQSSTRKTARGGARKAGKSAAKKAASKAPAKKAAAKKAGAKKAAKAAKKAGKKAGSKAGKKTAKAPAKKAVKKAARKAAKKPAGKPAKKAARKSAAKKARKGAR